MGDRVHIVAKYEHRKIMEDGMMGFLKKSLYSPVQRDWFNNRTRELADWLTDYCTDGCIDGAASEWSVSLRELESIPDEAFKDPIRGSTEKEMRRFIAECIRCAKMTDGECLLEWW